LNYFIYIDNIMRDILSVKHELMKNKETPMKKVVEFVVPEKDLKYYGDYYGGKLNHKYNMSRNNVDENELKKYVGGVQSTHAMTHLARQHYQEHARKNLEHQAKLHNLRLASNPNFYQDEEKSDNSVYDKIESLFNKLISQLKNNNYSRDIVNYVFDIQQSMLDKGFNLTSENLQEIKRFSSLADELLNQDVIIETIDLKDRGIYETISDALQSIIKIANSLQQYSNRQLRERKFAQEGIKKNMQKELFNKEKVFEDFTKIEEKLTDRLKYDRNYLDYKALKKQVQLDAIAEKNEKLKQARKSLARFAKIVKVAAEFKRLLDMKRVKDTIKQQNDELIQAYNDENRHFDELDATYSQQLLDLTTAQGEHIDAIEQNKNQLLQHAEQTYNLEKEELQRIHTGKKLKNKVTLLEKTHKTNTELIEQKYQEELKEATERYDKDKGKLERKIQQIQEDKVTALANTVQNIYELLKDSGLTLEQIQKQFGVEERFLSPRFREVQHAPLLEEQDEEPIPYVDHVEGEHKEEEAKQPEYIFTKRDKRYEEINGFVMTELKKLIISDKDKREYKKYAGKRIDETTSTKDNLKTVYKFCVEKGLLI